jgi:glutaredoxin
MIVRVVDALFVDMMILYSKDNCPACEYLKAEFKRDGVIFTEMKIGKDISLEEFKEMFPKVRTVPHVTI